MAEKTIYLTKRKYEEYEQERDYLKVVLIPENSQEIAKAREQGDLSENAEYDAARDEQRDLNARLSEVEEILKTAVVLMDDEVDLSKVGFGCTIRVFNMKTNKERLYDYVGIAEADSLNGKISNESPIGKALAGRKVGDIVDVEAPSGTFQLKILEITETDKRDKREENS